MKTTHENSRLRPWPNRVDRLNRVLRRGVGILAAILSLSTMQATTKTVTVTNTNDAGAGSLRQALLDAVDGETIDFSITGTITLSTGELLVDKNITISGPGAKNLTVDGNHTSRVFHVSAVTASISGLTIRHGLASGSTTPQDWGGGIFNEQGTLTVTACAIADNVAGYGGGICSSGYNGSATLTINASTISGNSTVDSGLGGGVGNEGQLGSGTLTIINSTISGNSASADGGAILSHGSNGVANLIVRNSTLSDNSAPDGGGISFQGYSGTSTVTMGSTIVNRGNAGIDIVNTAGTFTSEGYNITSDGGVQDRDGGTGSLDAPSDRTNTNPLLGLLADNGGPTFTHAPLPGSPALDGGKDLSGTGTDQRGRTRPVDFAGIPNAAGGDGSDVGAFEMAAHVVTNLSDNGPGSLRQTVADAQLGDAIVFARVVAGTITLLTDEIVIDKSLTIVGPGAKKLALSGKNAIRMLEITPGNAVRITGLAFRNGKTDSAAGAIYDGGSDLALFGCMFNSNQAAYGGAVAAAGANGERASLAVRSCTFSNNLADTVGGALYLEAGNSGHATMSIVNSTISDNSVTSGLGGAIYSNGGNGFAALDIAHSTFSKNSAANGGTIYTGASGGTADVTLDDTILNAGSGGVTIEKAGDATVTSAGYNLSSDGGGGFLTATGDQINTDPKLATAGLKDNGGATLTIALRAGSPAINMGDPAFDSHSFDPPLRYDNRGVGFRRVNNGRIDIGAYESGTPDHLRFSVQPSDTVVGTPISPAVRVQVVDAGDVLVHSGAKVTMSLGNNPSGATLGGTKTVTAVNGVAIFHSLTINKVGNGYTLVAKTKRFTGTSAPFDVAAQPTVEFKSAADDVPEREAR